MFRLLTKFVPTNPGHAALAAELAEKPEWQLADSAHPESVQLMAQCAGASYQTGILHLNALRARQRAARIGSTAGIIRGIRLVAETSARVQADAELIPGVLTGLPHSLFTPLTAGGGGGGMLRRGGLIGALIISVAALGLVTGCNPEQTSQFPPPHSDQVQGGFSRAAPEPPLSTKSRLISEAANGAAPSAETAPSREAAGLEGQDRPLLAEPAPKAPLPEAPPSEWDAASMIGAAAPGTSLINPGANTEVKSASGPAGRQEHSADAEQAPNQIGERRYVRGESVRMRRKPCLSASVVARFFTGDEMKVDRTESGWSRVTAIDGRSGWMATKYLTIADSTPTIRLAGSSTGSAAPARGATDGGREDPLSVGRSVEAEVSSTNFIVDTAPPAHVVLDFHADSGAAGDGLTNRKRLNFGRYGGSWQHSDGQG